MSVSRTLSSPSTRSRFSKDTVLLRGAPNALFSVGVLVDAHCALDSEEPEHPELISNVTYIARKRAFVSLSHIASINLRVG